MNRVVPPSCLQLGKDPSNPITKAIVGQVEFLRNVLVRMCGEQIKCPLLEQMNCPVPLLLCFFCRSREEPAGPVYYRRGERCCSRRCARFGRSVGWHGRRPRSCWGYVRKRLALDRPVRGVLDRQSSGPAIVRDVAPGGADGRGDAASGSISHPARGLEQSAFLLLVSPRRWAAQLRLGQEPAATIGCGSQAERPRQAPQAAGHDRASGRLQSSLVRVGETGSDRDRGRCHQRALFDGLLRGCAYNVQPPWPVNWALVKSTSSFGDLGLSWAPATPCGRWFGHRAFCHCCHAGCVLPILPSNPCP